MERPVPHTPPRPLHSFQRVNSSCRTPHARATMQPLLDTDGLPHALRIPATGLPTTPPHSASAPSQPALPTRRSDTQALLLRATRTVGGLRRHCCSAPPALWVDCDATAAARHPHRGWTATPLLLRATRTMGGLRRPCCCAPTEQCWMKTIFGLSTCVRLWKGTRLPNHTSRKPARLGRGSSWENRKQCAWSCAEWQMSRNDDQSLRSAARAFCYRCCGLSLA